MQGIIYKGIGGFYDVVLDGGGRCQCKPRGIFRKQGVKPLAGDRVEVETEDGVGTITAILPRKNALVRPPVANVDQLVIVVSTTQPVPSTLVIDKLCVLAFDAEIEPVLVFTKTDLCPADELLDIYASSGIGCIEADAMIGAGLDAITTRLAGRLTVLCGNSGVGKTTLLNALAPDLERETGQISQKLGRGRHTTREVELFPLCGGLLADTPGFASLDLNAASAVLADNLQLCYPEIRQRIGQCKFSGCTHVSEKGCAVVEAVAVGKMSRQRHSNYVTMYKEAKENENRY